MTADYNTVLTAAGAHIVSGQYVFGPSPVVGTLPTVPPSYVTIYEAFQGPIGNLPANPGTDLENLTDAQKSFITRLTAYYNTKVQENGTFDLGGDFSEWYKYNMNLYTNPNIEPLPTDQTNPRQALRDTVILNQVLMSLINMIGVIQKVAASQSEQLDVMAQWQQAYTTKLNQVKIFSSGDETVLGSPITGVTVDPNDSGNRWNEDGKAKIRNELNTQANNTISKLQANQSNVSDRAKAVQTNLNQSNDAATQQASMADSILQELSSLISAIFR